MLSIVVSYDPRHLHVRVLFLVPPPPQGGERLAAFTFLDEEIEGLVAAGVDAFVLSPAVHVETDCRGARLIPVPRGTRPAEVLRTAWFLTRHLRELPVRAVRRPRPAFHTIRLERIAADVATNHQIDLIHSHFGWPGGFGGFLAAREAGLPLVATLRGMDLLLDRQIDYGLRRAPEYDAALRRLLNTADRTTYASEFMRREGITLGAEPAAARVLSKGVDTDRFVPIPDRARLVKELGLEPPVIFSVATRLGRRKGLEHTLEALATLRNSHRFTFVICGDSDRRPALEAFARERGLADRTRFIGRISREEIPKYFAACDLFVLSSLIEAAGNVVLEAMSCGRPVVCTDAGGPGEYVQNGVTGFVVPVAHVQLLAEKIAFLLDHPGTAEDFGREGSRVVRQRYRYGQLVDGYLGIYQEVIGDRRPSRSSARLTPA